jgi:hypothetical protein
MGMFLHHAIISRAREFASATPDEITKASQGWVDGPGFVACAKAVKAKWMLS